MTIPFKRIDFGSSASEDEAEVNDQLLTDGFLDLHGAVDDCLAGTKFVILGRKGSGKSAVAQHLLLTSSDRNIQVRILNLRDMPRAAFPVTGDVDDAWQSEYVTIWKYQLLLHLLDMTSESNLRPPLLEVADAIRVLQSSGVLVAEDIAEGLQNAERLRDHFTTESHGAYGQTYSSHVKHLRKLFAAHPSAQPQLLFLDGLDDLIHPQVKDLRALAALIQAAADLNRELRRVGGRKILVLCRTDLFERLPGSNTAKVVEDQTVKLDWFTYDTPHAQPLISLVNRKAAVTDASIADISAYFAPTIGNRATLDYFLDNTRHTPRDLLRIFQHISKFTPPLATTVDHRYVAAGLKSYSNYFNLELRNEISGVVDEGTFDVVRDAIRANGAPMFHAWEIENHLNRHKRDVDILEVLAALFVAGGLGNVEPEFFKGKPRFTFKYRNPDSSLIPEAQIVVHNGWRRNLSLAVRARDPGWYTRRALRDSQATAPKGVVPVLRIRRSRSGRND